LDVGEHKPHPLALVKRALAELPCSELFRVRNWHDFNATPA
jgi:hypothetical protein